ncbi:ATPase [Candidatus Magnetomorum sp. HK-1]|nr:ATPase [Candidatus Magnetomorum sp. HK-1]
MKRQLYKNLLAWKNSSRRKPLLLQGARQVGKTYLLKEFGHKEYSNLAYFNFEQEPDLEQIFNQSMNVSYLINNLSAFYGKKIDSQDSLIFFDEIQASPKAVTSLKYFCEEANHFHVVAAGSLLGVSVTRDTSFPVGKVNFLMLYPMNFFEYLEASGEKMLIQALISNHDCQALPDFVHHRLLDHYKFYLYIGGMPEVVQHYLDHHDIAAVREIQKEILLAYERDFSKYSTKSEAIRISEIWQSIPMQLARVNKKFKYSDISKGGRASRFESSIEWLRKTGLIIPSYNIKIPKLPMTNYSDMNKFKIYMFDTGLLAAMLDLDSKIIVSPTKIFNEFKGAFIENFVATELISGGFEKLFYWSSKHSAEIDFLVKISQQIYPVEVKSGLSRKGKSLIIYKEKYKPDKVIRISPRNFTHDQDFINLPLYAISQLSEGFKEI